MHKIWSTIRAYDRALVLPDDQRECADYMFRFMKSRDEAKDLPLGFKDGVQPTRYFLRPLPKKAMHWIRQGEDDTVQALRAFAVALERIEHVTFSDGTHEESWTPERPKRSPGEVDAIPLDAFDLIPEMDMAHIGKAALDRATIPFDCGGSFQPLPSCASACLMRIASESRLAESQSATAATSDEASCPSPSSAAPSTEAPGAATAEAQKAL